MTLKSIPALLIKLKNQLLSIPRPKQITLAVVLLLLLVLSTAGTILFSVLRSTSQATVTTQRVTTTENTPTPTPPDPLRPRTIALLGYAGGTHAGGSLTDTLMLVHANPRNKSVVLISIPRDTWISVAIGEESTLSAKINTAYSVGLDDRKYPNKFTEYSGEGGGGSLAKHVIEQVTGLYPDYFVSVNFRGFITALESLGPLTVSVPVSFTDEYYPIEGEENNTCGRSEDDIATLSATLSGFELEKAFPCRFESITFTRGPMELDAETTLKFVRSRHSEIGGSDFGRALRQQAVIQALKNKLTQTSSIPRIIAALTSLHTYVQTDISLTEIPNLLDLFPPQDDYSFSTLVLDRTSTFREARSADGQYILLPQNSWEAIHTDIAKFIETANLEATQSATASSSANSSASP